MRSGRQQVTKNIHIILFFLIYLLQPPQVAANTRKHSLSHCTHTLPRNLPPVEGILQALVNDKGSKGILPDLVLLLVVAAPFTDDGSTASQLLHKGPLVLPNLCRVCVCVCVCVCQWCEYFVLDVANIYIISIHTHTHTHSLTIYSPGMLAGNPFFLSKYGCWKASGP